MSRGARALFAALAPFLGLLLVLALCALYGHFFKPEASFFSAHRLSLIAKQTAIVGMGALGMTAVVAAGGIDLSIGAMLALTSVTLAQALATGWSATAALCATLAVGIAAGALNGLLVTSLRLVPFIVTLGTMLVYRGLAETIADERKIAATAPAWLGGLLNPPARGSFQLVPSGVWIIVVLALLLALVLQRTVFGRHVFAIGSSEPTARLCGVAVERRKIEVYALLGFFVALAGVLEFDDLNGQGSPTSGYGMELDVIAAVVIGGGSLSGGRGSVCGSLVGALMITTLGAGCAFAEISEPVQKIVTGSIIIAAVALDRSRQARL
ncbi:MAG TPA: ABC transporter permease [Planctomycetota bacterium]|nr:ABC transporter permease [Planctomycetota bacterium]